MILLFLDASIDAPPTIVDALEEDLAKNTGEIEVIESSVGEANIFGLHGRRVVLIPQDSDKTPQSIQDVFSPQSQPLQGHTSRHARDLSPAVTPCVPSRVDPPDSPDEDHGSEGVFDNLMDSDEELEFEENLLRGNTVPGVRVSRIDSPHFVRRRL